MKKHNNKLVLALLMFCMILASMISMPNVQAASKIKLNKKSVTLEKGKSVTLKLKGTKKKVTWSSNKKKVATVTRKGKVVAKKVGTAKITAKVGKKKYVCRVKVVKAEEPQPQEADTTWKVMEVRTIGDYTYRMRNDGTIMVFEYNGNDTDIIIPSEVEGYPIKMIGDCMFQDNSAIVNAIISDGITQINCDVFKNCPNLTSVVVPESVIKIGDNSFAQCPNLVASVYDNSLAKTYMLQRYIPIKIIE